MKNTSTKTTLIKIVALALCVVRVLTTTNYVTTTVHLLLTLVFLAMMDNVKTLDNF